MKTKNKILFCKLNFKSNLINKQFKFLKPIKYVYSFKFKSSREIWDCYQCICTCGKTKITSTHKIKNKSCGHHKPRRYNKINKYKEGMRFGWLVIRKPIRIIRSRNELGYECECDCGNLTSVRTGDLTIGRVTSCGCLQTLGTYLKIQHFNILKQHIKHQIKINYTTNKITINCSDCNINLLTYTN